MAESGEDVMKKRRKMAAAEIALDMGDVGRDHSHEEEDVVLGYMRERLNSLANASGVRSECMIQKVKYEERQTNKDQKADKLKNIKENLKDEDNPYDPRVISIGPLHQGKRELEKMEDVKWRYLKNLLDKNEGDLAAYLDAVRSKEAEAKKCYFTNEFEKIHDDDTFSMMLVLDGCFLIEFLRKSRYPRYVPEQEKDEDVLNDFGWRLSWIKHDILLFENQLPFFVLDALFKVVFPKGFSSKRRNIQIKLMLDLSIDYLYYTELWDQHRNFWAFYADQSLPKIDNLDPSHLLHLYHAITVEFQHTPPFNITQKIRGAIKFVLSSLLSIVYWPMFFFHILFFANSALYPTKISTATELQEVGVRFQGSFMDLRFNKGTLFIPIFSLNYHSFSLLKNLIALEFYHPKGPKPIFPYVYCYAEFLTELIRSSDDLEIMENHHIIMAQNKDTGTRLISKLFLGSQLRETMMPLDKDFGYWQHPLERQEEMIKYCEQPRHRWRKKLMKDYFDSPWSILGLLVGLMLLVLTTLQTIFTMVPYYHPRP